MECTKRKQRPYTDYERQLLIQLVQPKIDVIGSRKTDGVSLRLKMEAWEEITHQFNSSNVSQTADTKQLKKMLQNLKHKSRDSRTQLEAHKKITAGESAQPDMRPPEPEVTAVMPNVLPFIKVEIDSDPSAASGTPLGSDNEDNKWLPKRPRVSDPEERDIDYKNEPGTNEEPRWTFAVKEASSGTLAIVPSNYNKSEENKKNKSLDELKRDLILQELEHNQKKFEEEMRQNEAKHIQEMEFLRRKQALEIEILELRKEKLLNNKTIDEYYV